MVALPLRNRRRGSIIHEAALAIVLAGIVLASVAQVLAVSAQQSRSMHQRLTATREAGDVMEQLMARSWQQLTPDAPTGIVLSESCQEILPKPQLDINIISRDPDNGQSAKQLNITLSWEHGSGNLERPVQLVAWKYPRQEIRQ